VVTAEGFPLGYEVYAGNTHDSMTVQTIVEALEKKYGTLDRVWVMDRGMVSEANLKFLRERGGKYIVGTPKQMLRQFEQHLIEQDWSQAAEWAFRITKDELEIRPIWHHKEDRVKAHILVCFLHHTRCGRRSPAG
jgi:transposase